MRTQTALTQWPRPPAEPECFLIDPAEWQEGQAGMTLRPARPVWVRELLEVPTPPAEWPYGKLAWLPDGTPVALAGDLPSTTTCMGEGVTDAAYSWDEQDVVVVVAWPDGTPPVKPTRLFAAYQRGDEVDISNGLGTFETVQFSTPARAAAFVAQLNGDQA